MDITDTIAPKSDQLNSDDLMAGPRTFTVAGVSRGDADQPVNVELVEFGKGRPYKPCKSMRRVLVNAWGKDASQYAGRRLTLYRDPAVKWGGQDVGGIRISHMSHIEKPLTLALTETRGKRKPYVVKPLEDVDPGDAPASAEAVRELRAALDRAEIAAEERPTFLAQRIGREIGNLKELTAFEVAGVLDFLRDGEPADGES